MRLFVSALFLAAVAAASAQIQTGPEFKGLLAMAQSQAGCPLALTSAQLNRPASYLPVGSAEKVTEPNLAIGFRNASGRAIRSADIVAELKVKRDLYALDATPIQVRLSFAGTGELNASLDQLARIPLPRNLHSYGVVQVQLAQVIYADGSLWVAPANGRSCGIGATNLVQAK